MNQSDSRATRSEAGTDASRGRSATEAATCSVERPRDERTATQIPRARLGSADVTAVPDPRAIVLTTERLRLTTWVPGDLPALIALHTDPVAMRHMIAGMESPERSRERLASWMDEHRTRGWSKWRIEDHEGTFLGRAGFGLAHGTGHRELGYLFTPTAWGQGYATELARALVSWHDEHPDPAAPGALRAYALADNTASLRVLAKAGFTQLGRDKDDPRQIVHELRSADPR